MDIRPTARISESQRETAFSVAEALVCVAVFGVIFAALFSTVTSSLSIVGSASDTLRAAQIMTEKLDTIRLYSWDNVTNPGYLPASFQVAYYPTNGLNAGTATNQGTTFNGTITLTNAPILTEDYSNDVKMIIVNLTWQRGRITHRAQMSTLFSHYGMQSYSIF